MKTQRGKFAYFYAQVWRYIYKCENPDWRTNDDLVEKLLWASNTLFAGVSLGTEFLKIWMTMGRVSPEWDILVCGRQEVEGGAERYTSQVLWLAKEKYIGSCPRPYISAIFLIPMQYILGAACIERHHYETHFS